MCSTLGFIQCKMLNPVNAFLFNVTPKQTLTRARDSDATAGFEAEERFCSERRRPARMPYDIGYCAEKYKSVMKRVCVCVYTSEIILARNPISNDYICMIFFLVVNAEESTATKWPF